MSKLKIVEKQPRRKGALSGRVTRSATLSRLDEVAADHVGPSPLDDAFARLESLGPDASEEDIVRARHHLRELLAEGLDGQKEAKHPR